MAPMKSVGANRPPGVPLTERKARGQDLQRAQHGQNLPGVLLVHGLVDVVVAGAHHLRKLDADQADQQARGGGLEILRPAGYCRSLGRREAMYLTKMSEAKPPITPRLA